MHTIEDNGMLVHYELTDNSAHVMNAKVEAESSLQYVKAANYISKVFGVPGELQTGALSKGSVVKIFWFEINNGENAKVISYIIARVFSQLFYYNKIVRMEDITKGLDDKDKIAVEEAMDKLHIDEKIIDRLNVHHHLKKARTEYFKQLKSCKTIRAVSIKHNEFQDLEKTDFRIEASSFDKYIEILTPETIIKEEAKVYIVSPVIVKDRTIKWNGTYEGNDIRFELLSNQFKTEAQNGEIDFRTGYFINCRLQYEETFDEDENPIHSNFKVLDVYGHGLDDNYVETPLGKKKRIEDSQPSLFDGLDDWQ